MLRMKSGLLLLGLVFATWIGRRGKPRYSAGRSLANLALAGTLLSASAAALAREGIAGSYRSQVGPDTASELVLHPGGKFEYFLAAGSLDEHAEGSWSVEGKLLRLTTIPKPVPATFSAGPIASTAESAMALHVTGPSGKGIAGVHFTIGFDSGEDIASYTQEYGWSLDGSEERTPRWVEFSVPIYQLRSQRFSIDLSKGNDLTYVLTPNDLGKIDFTDTRIEIEPHRLIMHRNGALITFEAAQSNGQ